MAFSALLRFHLASASRVALRASLPQIVGLFVLVGLQPAPGAFLGQLASGLATGESWNMAPLAMAIWSLVMARLVAQRLVPATRGWHRHLAVSPRHHRQTMLLACVVGQLPMAVFWLALWLGAWRHGMPVEGIYLLSLGLILFANASLALPSQRWWTLPLAGLSLLGAGLVSPQLWILGLMCLILREAFELGWMERRRKDRLRRSGGRMGLMPRVAWRALGGQAAAGLPVAALFLASCWLFLRNNDVDVVQAAVAVRLCGGLAITSVILQLADQLRLRRPPWAWMRSQPWSARQRVLGDSGWLALHCVPLLWVSAWLSMAAVPVLMAWTFYLSLRASAALWRQNPGAFRLGSALYAECAFVVLWVAVNAWTGVVLTLLLPVACRWAEKAEQRFKVSRFHEMHHSFEGETSS